MKRKRKLLLGIGGLLLSTFALSGCTANFCTVKDKAHIMYALDFGVSTYTDDSTAADNKIGISSNLFATYDIDNTNQKYIAQANSTAVSAGIDVPTVKFWAALDYKLLTDVATSFGKTSVAEFTLSELELTENGESNTDGALYNWGYLKFISNDEKSLWGNWDAYVSELIEDASSVDGFTFGFETTATIYEGDCPTSDYITIYKSSMNTAISSFRAGLATKDGYYGSYGAKGISVPVEGKAWTDWKGLLEFILIWPIGAFIDVLTSGFLAIGVATGWAQILSIFVVTIVIRTLVLLATFKSTKSNAKMTALQPEIQKIQNKYPNSKQNKYDQQRMSSELMALYKKNGVNPLSSLLTMIIQFPVFICVWGAMQGSAVLSTGTFLGLNLSQSISSALFDAASWQNGSAVTALVLFILMATSQVFSMLIPQWMQKARAKNVAKLGKNPSQNSQNKTMKIFTTVMLVMVIFMGFSLASGLGVYWFVGALFSIVQTLITQKVTDGQTKKNKYNKVVN